MTGVPLIETPTIYAAEAEWLRRAANVEKWIADPKKAILARIAGL